MYLTGSLHLRYLCSPHINHKFEMHLVSKLKMQGIKTININPGELLMEMQSMYFSSTCKSYSEMFTILQTKNRKKSTNQHSTISLTKLSMNSEHVITKGLAPFTQLVKVRRGKLVLALPSIRFS